MKNTSSYASSASQGLLNQQQQQQLGNNNLIGVVSSSSSSGSMQVPNGYLNALTQNGLGQQQFVGGGSSMVNGSGGIGGIGGSIGGGNSSGSIGMNMGSRNLQQQQQTPPMGFMSPGGGLGQGNAFRGMNTMNQSPQVVNNNTIIRGGGSGQTTTTNAGILGNQMTNNQGGLFQNQGNVQNTKYPQQQQPTTSVSPTQQLIHRSTTPNANVSANLLSSSSSSTTGQQQQDSYRPSESILSMINGQQQQQFIGNQQQQYPSSTQKQQQQLPPLPQHNFFRNVLNATPQQRQALMIQVRNMAQQNGFDNATIEMYLQEFLMYEQRYYQLQQQQLQQQQQQLQQQQQQRTPTADDKFGLLGLSNIFASKDSDLSALALGLDLTSLGLNLNSSEFLYQNFASPFAEVPPPSVILDYKLPDCYKVTVQLQDFHVDKFTEETLLYIFYTMPRDVLQIVAARELSKRGWKYHKPTQLWLIRDQSVNDFQQNVKAEKGTYFYFDTTTWTKKRKSGCVLEYDQLYNAAYFSNMK